jgi:hemolysin III
MFSVRAIYHRKHWHNPAALKWMKRFDHSAISVFIAGSDTPFAFLAMPPRMGAGVLSIVWTGAVAGVALKMWLPSAPRWVGVPLYLLLGWVAICFAGSLLDGGGPIVVA